MKSVYLTRDYSYRAKKHVFVQYIGGETYHRVPEASARAIVAAGAGKIVTGEDEYVGPVA